jgi:alpha-L-fucosidase 2
MNYLPSLSLMAVLAFSLGSVSGADIGLEHVSKHRAVFTQAPKQVPTQGIPDGPLLGNGDVGVALAGPPENQQFYIGKNDFWRRTPGDASVLSVGLLKLVSPQLEGASYHQEQDLARAELRGRFAKGNLGLQTCSWVHANENLLVTTLRAEGPEPLTVSIQQKPGVTFAPRTKAQVEESLPGCWFTLKADALPGQSREVAVVTRVLGSDARAHSSEGIEVILAPNQIVALVTAVLSDLDASAFLAAARQRLVSLKLESLKTLNAGHRQWWADFWGKSFLEIPDQEIERRWYAALYVMGSCSRPGKVAPGLWGNWVTTDRPNWHGDFHLNYNFQAPYYMVYSANHPELSLPFYQAIWESIPNGRAMAQRHGWKGIHFPVCIGPWGLSPENPDGDWGQRSDAAYAALNFIWQYQYTQDTEFLRVCAYPYLREVAEFWENYLKLEDGRYVIYSDSIHEGSGPDMNPILSLGLLRTLFGNVITMSAELGADAERRARWQDIVQKLSAFPVQERDGRTVFRYSEKGMGWCNDNTLGIQHIFPSGTIGLGSDLNVLEISRNTIAAMHRWHDNNGFSSWYTACARIGYDPGLILANMRKECDTRSYPNLILNYGGGGIENVSGFLAVAEMLLQSHEGVIRLFPVWPKEQPARFGNLRTVGAFLVSAELNNGEIGGVRVQSDKGRPCTIQNPWPGKQVVLVHPGTSQPVSVQEGERVRFETSRGETLELQPR